MADSTWIDWLKNPPKALPSQQKTPRQRTARVNLMNADIARPTAWTVGATPRADPAGTLAAPSATPGSTKHHRQEQLGASGHSRSRSPAVILLSYSTVHAMPRTSRAQEHKDNKWHFRAPPTQTPRLPAPPAVPARRSRLYTAEQPDTSGATSGPAIEGSCQYRGPLDSSRKKL